MRVKQLFKRERLEKPSISYTLDEFRSSSSRRMISQAN